MTAHFDYAKAQFKYFSSTAKRFRLIGSAKCRTASFPLQDPIKNIICHPE